VLRQNLEDRMQYLGRVVGIAALALGTTALSGCYAPPPPPPVAAITPDQTSPPPYPPPAYAPVATATPTPLTPPDSDYDLPQYGSTTAPAMAPSSSGTMTSVLAPYAPPTARAEYPPPAPSPLAMWQPGYWSWNGSQYVWTPGQYVERPTPTANWMPGYWQQGSGGWTWVGGHWTS
jgi:hypothetical protein